MPEFTVFVRHGIGLVTAVAFCSFRAVGSTGRIIIRNIIRKTVSEFTVFFCHGICRITSVAFCSLHAVGSTGRVIVRNIIRKAVPEFTVFFCHGICLVTAVTLRGLSAVGSTGRVIIRNIIRKTVSERISVTKRVTSYITANRARLIIQRGALAICTAYLCRFTHRFKIAVRLYIGPITALAFPIVSLRVPFPFGRIRMSHSLRNYSVTNKANGVFLAGIGCSLDMYYLFTLFSASALFPVFSFIGYPLTAVAMTDYQLIADACR